MKSVFFVFAAAAATVMGSDSCTQMEEDCTIFSEEAVVPQRAEDLSQLSVDDYDQMETYMNQIKSEGFEQEVDGFLAQLSTPKDSDFFLVANYLAQLDEPVLDRLADMVGEQYKARVQI